MFNTCSDKVLTSSSMESIGRLRSRPRVKGTIQKLHMFSQPRMMELKEKRKEGVRGEKVRCKSKKYIYRLRHNCKPGPDPLETHD